MTQYFFETSDKQLDVKMNGTCWREWVKAAILLGMALYLIFLILSGSLENYINVRFRWLTLVAIALLLALGLWSAWLLQRGTSPEKAYAHTGHLREALRQRWGAVLLLAVPLGLGTLLPSTPLGVEAITGGVSLNPVGGVSAAASANIPPEQRNILDWLREFSREGSPAFFNDQPVDVIGFIYREAGFGEDQFMIARFTMSCCVADAFAIGLPVNSSEAGLLANGEWVRIRGTLRAQTFNGELMPVIQPTSIEITEPPSNQYLYS